MVQDGFRATMGGRGVTARFDPRVGGQPEPKCKVLVCGVGGRDIDLTCNLTGAIAHALWQTKGGDSTGNWCEAERILEQLAGVTGAGSSPQQAGTQAMAGTGGAERESRGMPEVVVGQKRKLNNRR